MGPSIILDKSTVQSLGYDAVLELSRYFYTVTTPILVVEILADLYKKDVDRAKAEKIVHDIAKKIQPIDGFVNIHSESLCVHELLGGQVKMDRRPIVGSRPIVTKEGERGAIIESPEERALLRWVCGQFNESDELLATRWRESTKALDLESFKNRMRRAVDLPPHVGSLAELVRVVDGLMSIPKAQRDLLDGFLSTLLIVSMVQEVREWVHRRWDVGEYRSLRDFAPYVHHCIRVSFVFYLGLLHNLIGTRSTNRIDMGYFCYTPFAHIFSSGDRFHQDLSGILLEDDQSFVSRDELVAELNAIATMRRAAETGGEKEAWALEPQEDSLVRQLTVRHWGHWPKRATGRNLPMSKEEEERLRGQVRAITKAADRDRERRPPTVWP